MKSLNYFMNIALNEAKKAFKKNEIPIGAIIVHNEQIITKAHNLTIKNNNSLKHAELIVIEKALKKLKAKTLEDCTIFITCEPCIMCCGAILLSGISNIVYGCFEPKYGAAGSKLNILENNPYNKKIKIISGIMEDEAKKLLQEFFLNKR
ncbi:MAG TPA: nucleoside deaminase [Ignavibacteriales bacterium]|nr:nucleoside deaminase [Ignavibacteriales bacterium]HOL80989.1 nucleoside deaminase [Ignavibacteriales bacterium]HOM64725.1 nucleoside deaminase [Ignavibacteriales bacterium]HPD66743.1 nucleoside deaminase [Ignavibacteriales bacterium]HPP32769.1 nucleoside deaminase [Ignavibacteriales bacterium]